MSTSLISQVIQSRKNVLEIMEKQGYDTTGYANFSANEVYAMVSNNQLDMLLEMKQNSDDTSATANTKKIYIRYYLSKAIRPANLHEIISDLFVLTDTLKTTDTLYIIIKDEPNDTLINEIKQIWETEKIHVIVENIKRLQFNILKHVKVPEHIVIGDINSEEVKEVMKKHNMNKIEDFPEISRFDPVAKAICIRPGEVCKILRPSKTAIITNYYRVCV